MTDHDAARRIISHMVPAQLAAMRASAEPAAEPLRTCAEYGHDSCALPAPFLRRCMGEEWTALGLMDDELTAHESCAEPCNCCTTWNVKLGYPCTCPAWVR